MLAPQKVVAAAPAAVAPAFGAVSDCTSSGALAQNFKVSTNTSDSVSVGDFVALVFDYDLTVVVRSGARDGAGRGAAACAGRLAYCHERPSRPGATRASSRLCACSRLRRR